MMAAMTADDSAPTEADAPSATAPTVADHLLTLQEIDTEADQLGVRRQRLPEREQLTAKTEQLAAWERRRRELRERNEQLAATIEDADARSTALAGDKERLEAQLKTIIAPREAEALMNEISAVGTQIDELDMAELEAMEESSTIDDELAQHLELEPGLRQAMELADGALASVVADIDRDLAALSARRDDARAHLGVDVLARYDRVRSQLGVAVSRLEGSRCNGCHLDLSAAEVDTAKEESADSGVTDCPQCGRMLVVGR